LSTQAPIPAPNQVSPATGAPLAFLYENARWLAPVFSALERRKMAFDRIYAPDHFYDIGRAQSDFKVLFNRMSPSASSRQHGSGIFHTLAYLKHLDLMGVRVINGARAFQYEISKASQHSLLKSLGLKYIPSRVIHATDQAIAAASGLRYPILIKPNVGGSGKGIFRYDSAPEMEAAIAAGALDLGYDSVALVQEFLPARGGFITRVETLAGRYLYAIRVHLSGETFDLCPADICQTTSGEDLNKGGTVEAAKAGLKVEAYQPPLDVIHAIERIVRAAAIDVGGIEYMVDDRDGAIYYYDINALSNFVADGRRVVGFDPFEKLADFLQSEVSRAG
jgi:Carbamoyl-phosphate synthase L chain, ATP binding domain